MATDYVHHLREKEVWGEGGRERGWERERAGKRRGESYAPEKNMGLRPHVTPPPEGRRQVGEKQKKKRNRKDRKKFLDAFSHLYKRACMSVRPSVRRSQTS